MVGDKLRIWRERRGFSKRRAAAAVGVSQPVWLALEGGTMKRVGLDIAARVVVALDGEISLYDFLADESVARKIRRRCSGTRRVA